MFWYGRDNMKTSQKFAKQCIWIKWLKVKLHHGSSCATDIDYYFHTDQIKLEIVVDNFEFKISYIYIWFHSIFSVLEYWYFLIWQILLDISHDFKPILLAGFTMHFILNDTNIMINDYIHIYCVLHENKQFHPSSLTLSMSSSKLFWTMTWIF